MSSATTFAPRTAAFRDGEVALFELGQGPRLGYLHGVLGNPGAHPFLQALAQRHAVVAPSLPGFMPSPTRADLRFLYDWVAAASEILDLTGLTGAPLVASSVGAMVALELAAVRPEAVYRDRDTGVTYPGAVLLHSGLPLDLPPGDHASALVHLTRIS